MVEDVGTYLQELKEALVSTGADPALVQDALFDAEEYLQAEMAAREQTRSSHGQPPSADDRAAWFAAVVEGYGTPAEVAAAYVGATSSTNDRATDTPGAATTPTSESTPGSAPQPTGPLCPACAADVAPDQVFCTRCGTGSSPLPCPRPRLRRVRHQWASRFRPASSRLAKPRHRPSPAGRTYGDRSLVRSPMARCGPLWCTCSCRWRQASLTSPSW